MLLGAALCIPADVSRAAIDSGIVYNFDGTFSGTSPGGSTPWLTATFQNDGSAGVLLTISGTDLAGGEQLNSIYFNVNPAYDTGKPPSLPTMTFARQSSTPGLTAPTINQGEDAFKADGDGLYDIELSFSTSMGMFQNGDSITYLISGISGLSASDFAFESTPAGGHGPFYAAAQIQGISPNNQSGWVEPSAGPIPLISMVPEPAAFGVAAVVLASVVTLRRKKSA